MYKHGKIKRTIYDHNVYTIEGDICYITLFDKTGSEAGKAIIDKSKINICKEFKWSIKNSCNTKYVMAHDKTGNKMFLHRLILGYDGNLDVDHINHNGLDNRVSNLRVITRSANTTNQRKKYSGIKLVDSGRYQCSIMYDYKNIYLGTFDTMAEALDVRNEKFIELHGFAK